MDRSAQNVVETGLLPAGAGFQGEAGPPGWLPACRMQGTLEKPGTRER